MMRWKRETEGASRFSKLVSTPWCRFRKDCWMQSGSNHWWRVLVLDSCDYFILNFYLWSKLSKELFHAGGWGDFLAATSASLQEPKSFMLIWSGFFDPFVSPVDTGSDICNPLCCNTLPTNLCSDMGRICRVEYHGTSICISYTWLYTWFKGISTPPRNFFFGLFYIPTRCNISKWRNVQLCRPHE